MVRRTIQVAVLVALPLLPLAGWVRVDVENANLTLFGIHIWAHEAGLVVLMLASGFAFLAGLSAVAGRFFCGWICPQTALSELATFVESRVRQALRERPLPAKVAAIIAGTAVALAVGATGGLSIITFFVPFSALAELAGPPLNTSLLKAITISTILVVVVVAVFRHMWCEWMCLFGWWQRLFAGPGSLRVGFDTRRSKSCTNCNACSRVCFMKLEPRRRQLPPTCVNCAECVAACALEMAPLGQSSLINLGFPAKEKEQPARSRLVGPRLGLAGLLVVVATSALTVASATRQPVQVEVRLAERLHLEGENELKGVFHVDVYNNLSQPLVLDLAQEGLADTQAWFMPSRLVIEPRTRARTDLRISAEREGLAPGRRTVNITARAGEDPGRAMVAEGRIVFIIPPANGEARPADALVIPANIGKAN